MTVKVDPTILRRFSEALTHTGKAIGEIDILTPFRVSENALRSSEFGTACAAAAAATVGAVAALARRVDSVADIARGVAQNYEVTDDELARRLAATGGPK